MTTPTLPRGDVPEHHLRAWLYDGERTWLDALDCDDLVVSGSVRVVLQEHRKRKSYRGPRTDEQDARHRRACDLLPVRSDLGGRTRQFIAEICRLRRDLHYARARQEPPALPDDDSTPSTTSEPTTEVRSRPERTASATSEERPETALPAPPVPLSPWAFCPNGGEIVDYKLGLCSCGACPTPRPDTVRRNGAS